jgi:hypothetical protein
MCSYVFIKTLTFNYVQGCKNNMINVCMHAHTDTHSIYMTDIHTMKQTLCGHKLMKLKCYDKGKKTMQGHRLNYLVLVGLNDQLFRTL